MLLELASVESFPENEFDGNLSETPLHLNLTRIGDEDGQYVSRIYIWEEGPGSRGFLIEGPTANKTVHLIGQYYFRYDPPRTSSTGSGQEPVADYHLYRGKGEIAAWNDQGHARHGFPSGTKLPKKAFDTLMQKYPGCCGITGRVLEHLQDWTLRRMLLIEGTENPCTLTLQ
jgi:hypothetical protein